MMWREIDFRAWALINAIGLAFDLWVCCWRHRVACRANPCDPFDHITLRTALMVAHDVWWQEIVHGPHLGYGYDHRLPELWS
jgi:hypothetical protein